MSEFCELFLLMRYSVSVKPIYPALTERKKNLVPLLLESQRRLFIEQVATNYGERGIVMRSALIQEAFMGYHRDEAFVMAAKSLENKSDPKVIGTGQIVHA